MAETQTKTAAETAPTVTPVAAAPETRPVEVANEAPAPAEQAAAVKATTEKAPQPVKAAAVRVTRPAKAAPVKTKRPSAKAAARKIVRKKVRKPVRAVKRIQIQGVETMTKQTNQAGVFAADQLKTVFGDANERAKTAMEKGAKIVEEIADLTRGNVEALVASSKVAAKGVETLSQDVAEFGRKSFEEASATLKSFAEVKSATDFFKLQSDYARSAFDAAVAESARASETFLKIAGDVAEPITSRYTVAAERVKTLAA